MERNRLYQSQHGTLPLSAGGLVLQSEDVVVDRRGYIYVSDKNQGVWILRYRT